MTTIFRPNLLEGTSSIVTGGGTGIGFTIACELAELGSNIAICGRREEPLLLAKTKLESHGVKVFASTCDIRQPDSVTAYVEAARSQLGPIHHLVNNAGGQFPSPALGISSRGFEAVVRNNLLGTWTFTRTVAEALFVPEKRGRIVNITAEVSRGFPGMAHTGAARAGVENLTKTLAVEWAMHGIRVNAVAPGVIKTSGTKQYPPELMETAILATPLKRLGDPREVSHLVTYLLLPHSEYITGQTFTIDGGASLWGNQWDVPNDVPQHPPYPDTDEGA